MKKGYIIGIIIALIALIFVIFIFNQGKAYCNVENEVLYLKGSLFNDEINISEITTIELIEDLPKAKKINGINTNQYYGGLFHNEQLGNFYYCVNIKIKKYIKISAKGKYYIFNQNSIGDTLDIYSSLQEKIVK